MRKMVVLGLLGTLLLLPMASAQGEEGEEQPEEAFEPTFENMLAEVESLGSIDVAVQSKLITFSWSDIAIGANMSSWIRGTIDELFTDDSEADGEPDGDVSVEEMQQGEELLSIWVQGEFDQYVHQTTSSGYFVIDQTNPQTAEVTDLETSGIVGPVDSEEGITLGFDLAVAFPTENQDVHTVTIDMGPYYFRPVDEEAAEDVVGDFGITVRGGEDWALDASSIQPSCAAENWDEEAQAIVFDASDVNCFTGHSGLLLSFTITGDEGDFLPIPGFELPLIVLGLLGGALLLRRRQT